MNKYAIKKEFKLSILTILNSIILFIFVGAIYKSVEHNQLTNIILWNILIILSYICSYCISLIHHKYEFFDMNPIFITILFHSILSLAIKNVNNNILFLDYINFLGISFIIDLGLNFYRIKNCKNKVDLSFENKLKGYYNETIYECWNIVQYIKNNNNVNASLLYNNFSYRKKRINFLLKVLYKEKIINISKKNQIISFNI